MSKTTPRLLQQRIQSLSLLIVRPTLLRAAARDRSGQTPTLFITEVVLSSFGVVLPFHKVIAGSVLRDSLVSVRPCRTICFRIALHHCDAPIRQSRLDLDDVYGLLLPEVHALHLGWGPAFSLHESCDCWRRRTIKIWKI
jgi:hypothetical protein